LFFASIALIFTFLVTSHLNEEILIALFLLIMFRLLYLYTGQAASFYFFTKIEMLYVYFIYLIRSSIHLSSDVLKGLNFVSSQFSLIIIPFLRNFFLDQIEFLKEFELSYLALFFRNASKQFLASSLKFSFLGTLSPNVSSRFISDSYSLFTFLKKVNKHLYK